MNKPLEFTLPAHTPVVGKSPPHESAQLHVEGQAPYVDDLPEWCGTLHAALGLAPLAHGTLHSVDIQTLKAQAGVVAVFLASDIPGTNDCGPIIHDEPVLATGTVEYLGQPVYLVVAQTRDAARRAAALAPKVIEIDPLEPVLNIRQGHARQLYVAPPMRLARGDAASAIAQAPQRLGGSLILGGQEQFYLEGHISYALPQEDGAMKVLCSTQHPSEMQHAVSHVLGLAAHKVQVECRRMGGGFGGKESQSAVFACCAAMAAHLLRRPVKLRVDRDDDFMITGRRHGFEYDWQAGFDAQGRILGLDLVLLANAGCTADLSAPVMTRAICHVDNAYWLPAVDLRGYCVRTHTQSNTAFRGFGGPQGVYAIECIIDTIARHLGLDALLVRQANFYGHGERHLTPYGQEVEDCIAHELVARLCEQSGYWARRQAVNAFNASSPVLKRGLALTPVKFGISFNLAHLNQAGALVHVYTDGSVLVNHGGTEMGQGLNTKVAQVVAQELGLPLSRVRSSSTDTHKVANTSATAASTGSDLNGKAAQAAARKVRQRLSSYLADRHGIDESRISFADGKVYCGPSVLSFEEAVLQAYSGRVQLWSDGFYATPGLHWDRNTMTGKPFHYFAYGAAVSEVLLDTLTGESRVLATDILHDAGTSLNPAIDIGQIEGGFIQGMGWLLMEELWWHPKTGRLMTHAPSTYKVPTANDCPEHFRVSLFDRANSADTIHRSKAVGEPPLLLAFSAFLAVKDAMAAAVKPGVSPGVLHAPATPQAVIDALDASA